MYHDHMGSRDVGSAMDPGLFEKGNLEMEKPSVLLEGCTSEVRRVWLCLDVSVVKMEVG